MSDTARVKICHASMEVFDTDRQAMADLEKLIALDPDIICGTESGSYARQNMFREALTKHHYRSFVPARTDGWIAVKADFVSGDWHTDYTELFGSGRSRDDPHHYTAKGVVQVSFRSETLGHITVVGGGHYLTKGRWPGQAQDDAPGDPVNHVEDNKALAHAMANAAIEGSEGAGISFLTADTNLIDRTVDVFYGKPLTTCWDELGKWPNTGHGNIDVIATVDFDKRVTCKSAHVLDDTQLTLFSDHYPVVATYRVKKLERAA